MKKLQLIMVWFLPLVVIGGFFYPVLGYFVVAAVIFMLALSIFKPRYWCWNLCPRGSFLDLCLSKISRNKPLPRVFMKQWFRWAVFLLIAVFLIYRLVQAGRGIAAVGLVFVIMCLISTIIAITLGIITRHRAWCTICPMGLLQEKIGKLKRERIKDV